MFILQFLRFSCFVSLKAFQKGVNTGNVNDNTNITKGVNFRVQNMAILKYSKLLLGKGIAQVLMDNFQIGLLLCYFIFYKC